MLILNVLIPFYWKLTTTGKKMKNKFRLIISSLFFFFATQAYSNQINQINYIGIDFTSKDFLQEIIPFKTGKELTKTDSNNIIESFFKTGFFSDISISVDKDQLNITLIENPYIKYIEINYKNLGNCRSQIFLFLKEFVHSFTYFV